MKVKRKILAVAGVLALAGGLGLAGVPAQAATPSCGPGCINTYPQEYAGQTNDTPQFVVDVFRQKQAEGNPVILFRASNADPAEDWSITDQGTVSDFYAAGLVSAAFALHYGCNGTLTVNGAQIPCVTSSPNGPVTTGVDDVAWELQYAPFGVDSGLCMGVASTAVSGEGVTLQPCGVSSKTVWAEDTFSNDDSDVPNPNVSPGPGTAPDYWVAINGSDTNFSNPFVLTYPGDAFPTDKPRVELVVDNLQQFTQGTSPDDSNQLWSAFTGILP